MKKDKNLAIQLINNKGKMTFEEIAVVTGYHPKSLIRMKKNLSEDQKFSKKFSDKEKKYIIDLFNSSGNGSITSFYEVYLNDKKIYKDRTYSGIYKLLNKEGLIIRECHDEAIIIGNVKVSGVAATFYYAFELKTERLLYLFKSEESSLDNYIKCLVTILINSGIPKEIYCYGSSFMKNNIYKKNKYFTALCERLGIKLINDINYKIDAVKKRVEKIISKGNMNSMITKGKTNNDNIYDLSKIIVNEEVRKICNNSTIYYKGSKYILDTGLRYDETLDILITEYWEEDMPTFEYGGKIIPASKVL